jgi:hypothetical protein
VILVSDADLPSPHFCFFSKPGPEFPTSYVEVFFVVDELTGEMVVPYFVDIDGIVDHPCLSFLFLIF